MATRLLLFPSVRSLMTICGAKRVKRRGRRARAPRLRSEAAPRCCSDSSPCQSAPDVALNEAGARDLNASR